MFGGGYVKIFKHKPLKPTAQPLELADCQCAKPTTQPLDAGRGGRGEVTVCFCKIFCQVF